MPSFSKSLRLTMTSLRHHRVYASMGEAYKAHRLRLAAHRGGDAHLMQLRLRQLTCPLHLRRGTSDFLVVREIFERGSYETAARWNLGNDSVILDLGGNIGLATVYLCSIFKDARAVIVEPDAANIEVLSKNCEHLIDQRRLKIVHAFADATDGFATIDRSGGYFSFRKSEIYTDGERVRCLSIPSILNEAGVGKIDLLKCDIEGGEQAVFANAASWINAVDHIAIETHLPYSNQNFLEDLNRADWAYDVLQQRQRSRVGECFVSRRK